MPRAVVCRELGPPEKLTLEDVARAPLAPGQVRVAIHAAGLNFPDILMAAGAYQLKPPLPFTPGMEAAGEVIEVAGADGFHPGDKVIVKARFGCYADEIIAAPDQLMPLPLTFDYAQGAAFLAAHGTAWHALHDRARIAPGEVLLVHGAGGGWGSPPSNSARWRVPPSLPAPHPRKSLKLPSSVARIMGCFMAANRSRTR
jgi:NADPH2:quinone reductase